jgi:glutamate synthase domain-containing protein 3
VLGQNEDGLPIINNFCSTGMHGGVVYLRCERLPHKIPKQVKSELKFGKDIPELVAIVKDYCKYFKDFDSDKLLSANFTVLTPDTENPYKRMYTNN